MLPFVFSILILAFLGVSILNFTVKSENIKKFTFCSIGIIFMFFILSVFNLREFYIQILESVLHYSLIFILCTILISFVFNKKTVSGALTNLKINTYFVVFFIFYFNSNLPNVFQNLNSENLNSFKSILVRELEKSQDLSKLFAENTEFVQDLSSHTFINSPLEPTVYNLIIDILTKDLILHASLLYLVFILFFIFTFKLIADRNLYTLHWENKIKSLPLGNFINNLLIKLFNSWKVSSILWIYFIILILFIGLVFSTFGIYGCLVALKS